MNIRDSPSDMSLEQAYRLLGLKPKASASDVQKAYRRVVKEAHPDVGGDPGEFVKFNTAYSLIKAGRKAQRRGFSLSDVRKEYRKLAARLSPGSTSVAELNDAEVSLRTSKEYRNDPDAAERLGIARDLLEERLEYARDLSSRTRSKFDRMARRALMTEEKREEALVKRMNEQLQVRSGFVEARDNIQKALSRLTENIRVRAGRVEIPVVSRVNGKKVVRYVALTTALAAAIAAGAWFFNRQSGGFEEVSGYLEDKR